jgi:Phospholipase_D-nuclease N-terminal
VLRALPILILVALAIYCLVDVVQSPPDRVRTMPRWAWALVIVAIPLLGAIGWFLAGRPLSQAPYRAPGSFGPETPDEPRRVTAPDDDPEFLNKLKQQQLSRENERLRKWQAELERRERELGDDDKDKQKKPSDGQPDQQ